MQNYKKIVIKTEKPSPDNTYSESLSYAYSKGNNKNYWISHNLKKFTLSRIVAL